jgi:hypothetical protein
LSPGDGELVGGHAAAGARTDDDHVVFRLGLGVAEEHATDSGERGVSDDHRTIAA